jgi:hypothetical protein
MRPVLVSGMAYLFHRYRFDLLKSWRIARRESNPLLRSESLRISLRIHIP